MKVSGGTSRPGTVRTAGESFGEAPERWPPSLRSLSFTLGSGGSRPNSAGLLEPGLLRGDGRPTTVCGGGNIGLLRSEGGRFGSLSGTGFGEELRPSTVCGSGSVGLLRQNARLKSGRLSRSLGSLARPHASTCGALAEDDFEQLSPSSRGDPFAPPPSRAQSRNSVRRALSPKATAQNARAGKTLQALGRTRSQSEAQALGDDFKKHLVKDENDFSELVSSVTKNIEDGFRSMNKFDGNTTAMSPKHTGAAVTSPRARAKGSDKTEEQEERDRRFELYKMVRKIEPEELTPLDRSCLNETMQKIDCEQPMVKYNASREALDRYNPQAKMEKTVKLCAVRDKKELTANLMRTALLSQSAGQWLALLHKKQAQGQEAVDRQRTCLSKKALKGAEALPREWLTFLSAGAFLNQARESLVVAKMTPEERTQYYQVHRRSASKATAEGDATAKRVQRYGDVLRAKLKILRRRKGARMIFGVMKQWQVGGTTLMLLKDFGHRIRRLQRWWRRCAVRLTEQRMVVSRRWRTLEKEDLHHRFPMCDSFKIQEESISEAVRVEFIRNEVRSRRYLVLPQIALWEADVAKWRKAMQEWSDTRAAHRAMGVLDMANMEVKNTTVFSWPETRPSHLPPKHPNHQARTCSCPEDCPGRRGDAEIVSMICRCREWREGGGGWRTISGREYEKKGGKKKSMKKGDKGRGGSTSPYGVMEASDQELQRYGVHLESLPCLSRGHDEVH